MLETSALETLCVGQSLLSTQLVKPVILLNLPPTRTTVSFFQKVTLPFKSCLQMEHKFEYGQRHFENN